MDLLGLPPIPAQEKSRSRTIAILGTADTKGAELTYLTQCIREQGLIPLVIDVSARSHTSNAVAVDVRREEVLKTLRQSSNVLDSKPRAVAVERISTAVAKLMQHLYAKGAIDGAIGMAVPPGQKSSPRRSVLSPLACRNFACPPSWKPSHTLGHGTSPSFIQ